MRMSERVRNSVKINISLPLSNSPNLGPSFSMTCYLIWFQIHSRISSRPCTQDAMTNVTKTLKVLPTTINQLKVNDVDTMVTGRPTSSNATWLILSKNMIWNWLQWYVFIPYSCWLDTFIMLYQTYTPVLEIHQKWSASFDDVTEKIMTTHHAWVHLVDHL